MRPTHEGSISSGEGELSLICTIPAADRVEAARSLIPANDLCSEDPRVARHMPN